MYLHICMHMCRDKVSVHEAEVGGGYTLQFPCACGVVARYSSASLASTNEPRTTVATNPHPASIREDTFLTCPVSGAKVLASSCPPATEPLPLANKFTTFVLAPLSSARCHKSITLSASISILISPLNATSAPACPSVAWMRGV